MSLPALNNSRTTPSLTAALLFAFMLLVAAAPARALPVAVEQVKGSFSLIGSAFYLADPPGTLSIAEVSAPARQNRFVPLKDGIAKNAHGALWLRFSLIKNNVPANAPRNEAKKSLTLELGPSAPPAKLFVAETITTEGNVRQWREHSPTADGSFELPDPVLLPLTVYVRLEAMPPLWFAPQLTQPADEDQALPWLLIMRIALGLALAVTIVRGMSENEEWRFWAGAILACVTISALYNDNGAEKSVVYLSTMPQLLTPGLAIMLMPHLGRYMLGSNKSKALDYALIALSLPGVATALIPLAPGLGWTARLLPLAPLLLLPLILLALLVIRKKQPGAFCYLLFCLFPCLGAGLALYALYAPQHVLLYQAGVYLPAAGYLLSGILMALVKPVAATDKSDFFPLNDYLDGGAIAGPLAGAAKASEQPGSTHGQDEAAQEDKAQSVADDEQDGDLEDTLAELQDSPPLRMAAFAPRPAAEEEQEADESAPQKKAVEDKAVEEPGPAPTPLAGPGEDLEDILELDASLQITPRGKAAPEAQTRQAGQVNPALAGLANLADLFGDNQEEASAPQTPSHFKDAAPTAQLRRADNIIYVKDEEEPGLVILKPAEPGMRVEADPTVEVQPAAHQPQLDGKAINRVESALREPYENMLLQLSQLRGQQTGNAELADKLENSINSLGLMLDNLEKVARGEHPSPAPTQTIFNLSALIRRIHEQMLPLAESKGVTLSWFVAPVLPTFFKGNEEKLSDALLFLLQGSLEAADSGAVQLTVREAHEHQGQVQFTLLESGLGVANLRRPSGWLNKAWELSGASNGSFNIESLPGKGMAVTFTLALAPLPKPAGDLYDEAEPPLSGADFTPGSALLEDAPAPAAKQTQPKAASAAKTAREPLPEDATQKAQPQPAAPAAKAAQPAAPEPLREYIVIADMAASGRRLIARRLDGLPHKLVEARNAQEVTALCAAHPVGLIIFDADMPEADVRTALQGAGAERRKQSLPPIPTLGLITHASQAERMTRLGCSQTQIKSASRTQFRQTVLELCPHPEADPAELLPESPLLRAQPDLTAPSAAPATPAPAAKSTGKPADAAQTSTPASAPADAPLADTPADKARSKGKGAAAPTRAKGERVPMLDMIVASMEQNEEKEPAAAQSTTKAEPAKPAPLPEARILENAYKLAQSDNDYMDAAMVPLLPGFLIVLEDTLEDLQKARTQGNMTLMQEVAARMAGQGGTYGLNPLERMARCVERASEAKDKEAVKDLSEELLKLGRRYLSTLKLTYDDYLENKE